MLALHDASHWWQPISLFFFPPYLGSVVYGSNAKSQLEGGGGRADLGTECHVASLSWAAAPFLLPPDCHTTLWLKLLKLEMLQWVTGVYSQGGFLCHPPCLCTPFSSSILCLEIQLTWKPTSTWTYDVQHILFKCERDPLICYIAISIQTVFLLFPTIGPGIR